MADAVEEADLADPNPDVRDLFRHYDGLYFQGALADAGFKVQWGSTLASSSFGSCTFSKPHNTITLSEPMLKYLSCIDRKNALLHEMIHAIIYVKHHRRGQNQHGPVFRAWMDAINSCSIKDNQRPDGGYNITTRHDFSPEKPRSFKSYLWKCKSCGDELLRPTNQGPPSDACCIENVDDASCSNMLCHWHNHKNECCGAYEKAIVQSNTPADPRGAQLLLTFPSEASKSQGAIQESSSTALQENTEVTTSNAADKYLPLVSISNEKPLVISALKKAGRRQRPEVVQRESILPAEPPTVLNGKQALIAAEDKLFSLMGCNAAKSPRSSTSKKAHKGHKPEDVQNTSVLEKPKLKHELVATEKHELSSIQDSKKEGKRRKPDDVQKPSVPPAAPLGTPKVKHELAATEKHRLFSVDSCKDAKSLVGNTSRKAAKQHKQEIVQNPSVLPAVPLGSPKVNHGLVATEKHQLSSVEGCNDAKLPGNDTSRKADKRHKPDDVQKPSVPPSAPLGTPKLEHALIATEKHKLFSVEGFNDAKSPKSNTLKKTVERHMCQSAEKAYSRPAYPQRRLKQDLVASEKNELSPAMDCSYERLLDRSSSKNAHKQHEFVDIQKKTVLPAASGSKRKETSYRKPKPAREKEYAVMSAWLDYYESDRSSGSTDPLVNKRTERRKRERAKIHTYSRSKKKISSAPMDDSWINASVSSHTIETMIHRDESMQQSWQPSPCLDIVVATASDQMVVNQATGDQSKPSAPCLDIVPFQSAGSPGLTPPGQSTAHDIIDISDDDLSAFS